MVKFTVCGFEVAITFGFLLVICLLSLTGSPSLGFIAAASCIIHELGHCFAAIILNVKMKSLMLWAGGIQMQRESKIISLSYEIIILLSGPFFNLIFAAIYAYNSMLPAAGINFMLALFNLLPYTALDGGSIIKAVLENHNLNCNITPKIISLITGIILLLYLYTEKSGNITALVTVILLTINEFTGK